MMVALLGIGSAACQKSVFGAKNSVVPQLQRSDLLVGGQHSGLWDRYDLTLYYSYERSPQQLKLSGEIHFAPYLQKNFPYLNYFHMSMLLLDAQGHVLATKPLVTSNYFAGTAHPLSFSVTVALPVGTTAMAFGYTGKAQDITNESGGDTTSFSFYPTSTLP